MGLYGNLLESVKVVKHNDKYNYTYINVKIKGVNISIADNDLELSKNNVEKASKIIEKNWKEIILHAAKDMYDKVKEISEYNESLKSSLSRFKSSDELSKQLKIESIIYSPNKNIKSKPEIIGNFDLTLDVNPPLDPNHVYTLYCAVNKNGTVGSFESMYDG